MPNYTFSGYVRPLRISALDVPQPINVSSEDGAIALRFLGDLVKQTDAPLAELRRRNAEVTSEEHEPWMIPNHETIIKQVIRPLREAKQCYVLGMSVACIAQAGLVGEMVAIWRFMMLKSHADDELTSRIQNELGNHTFDELNQEKRVDVLKKCDCLDHETKDAFAKLRKLRREYLHYMVGPEKVPDADARISLKYASTLVTKTLDVQWDGEGRIMFSPMVMQFIRRILTIDDD